MFDVSLVFLCGHLIGITSEKAVSSCISSVMFDMGFDSEDDYRWHYPDNFLGPSNVVDVYANDKEELRVVDPNELPFDWYPDYYDVKRITTPQDMLYYIGIYCEGDFFPLISVPKIKDISIGAKSSITTTDNAALWFCEDWKEDNAL